MEGPRHPRTLSTQHNLAIAHARAGHLEQATTPLNDTIAGRRDVLAPEHPDTVDSLLELVRSTCNRNAYTEAEPLLLEAHQLCLPPLQHQRHGQRPATTGGGHHTAHTTLREYEST